MRAGDFFGPKAGNNWFSQGLIQPGKTTRRIQNPAMPGIGHQWSYLPDVASNIVELLARRESLEPFATFHLGGYWDADGTQIAQAIRRALQKHGVNAKVDAFPWWLIAPFNATLREVMEMRYLWRKPVRMDNGKLLGALGRERVTPLDEAVEALSAGLNRKIGRGLIDGSARAEGLAVPCIGQRIAAGFSFSLLASENMSLLLIGKRQDRDQFFLGDAWYVLGDIVDVERQGRVVRILGQVAGAVDGYLRDMGARPVDAPDQLADHLRQLPDVGQRQRQLPEGESGGVQLGQAGSVGASGFEFRDGRGRQFRREMPKQQISGFGKQRG
ncbi:hypothetical protein ABD440_15715 [Chromobacterium piscinae]